MSDGLTAPAGAVPRRRTGVLRLGDCWRAFIRQPSPPPLLGAIAAAAVLRGLLGDFDWRDPVVVACVLAATPPVEWVIRVYPLHARPFVVVPDPPGARGRPGAGLN